MSVLQQDSRVRKITEAGSGEEALQQAKEPPLDLLFLDLNMPGKDGLETLTEISTLRSNLKVVILTATQDNRTNISRKLDIQGVHHLTRFAVEHLEWLNGYLKEDDGCDE